MKFRVTVYRSWGQISVKDFDSSFDFEGVEKYVYSTWSDINKTEIKIIG